MLVVRERVTESHDAALTLRFLFPKCCGSSCSPAPPLLSSLASAVIALLKLWETEAGRSHDTAIQHLRHRPTLGPLLSSPQSETHHGKVQYLEGLALARVQINQKCAWAFSDAFLPSCQECQNWCWSCTSIQLCWCCTATAALHPSSEGNDPCPIHLHTGRINSLTIPDERNYY